MSASTLALALLAAVLLFVVAAWGGWLLGWGLKAWVCAAIAVAGTAALLRSCGLSAPAAAQGALLVPVLGALLAAVAGTVRDLSTDGQLYHQQAIMLMSQGWNPLQQPASPLVNWSTVWVDGYAKTHWVYAALLMDLGTGIEAGKSFTWMLALAAALLVHALLAERLGWRPRQAALVAATVVLNPVLATEWPTFLNDHTLACTLLIALAALMWAAGAPAQRHARRAAAWLLVVAFALLASVKASGVAYGGVFLVLAAPLLLWGWGFGVALRVGVLAASGIAVGVLVLGFNPYVTNTLRHGHPFYPLAGEGKLDIISNNIPAGVAEQSRPVKLFGSLFARSSSTIGGAVQAGTLAPKLPGAVSMAELKLFLTKNDVRIGGFGPWFSLALLLSAASACWAWRRRRRTAWQQGLLLAPTALLLLSALAFPEPWWARYVPQVWLIPLAVAVTLITLGRSEGDRVQQRAGWVVVGVAALNTLAVALLFLLGNAPRQLDVQAQLDSLRALSETEVLRVDVSQAPAQRFALDGAGIRWQPADAALACQSGASWVRIEYTYGRVCLSEAQRARHRAQSPLVDRLKALL